MRRIAVVAAFFALGFVGAVARVVGVPFVALSRLCDAARWHLVTREQSRALAGAVERERLRVVRDDDGR